jgi:dihydrofolate reductase
MDSLIGGYGVAKVPAARAREGGTTFTFVTDGIAAALELARRAARGQDVSLAGGANTAQQYYSKASGTSVVSNSCGR